MVYDCAIIGTGPAGLSAALTLRARDKDFIWIGSKNLSDKIRLAECISNYPGFTNVSGEELVAAFKAQAAAMDIGIAEQMVNSIMEFSGHYALLAGPEFYEAKSVILTTGVAGKAALPGESELLGRGVSYCATCDGNLYKGRRIAIICNNRRFEDEVKYLAEIADKVYYFPIYKEPSVIAVNVEKMSVRASEILGEGRVSAVRCSDGRELAVDGVFCLRDSIVLSNLLPGLEMEEGHIKVNRRMETNLTGIFAAGDCTGRPYQYTKAAGEGNVAAHSVLEYLAEK